MAKPTIYNVTMTSANTEYSKLLPDGARKVLLHERAGGSAVKYAFVSGESGSVYMTIPAASSKYLEASEIGGRTIYFQCPDAGKILEIEVWT
jgi:hypothetical protein